MADIGKVRLPKKIHSTGSPITWRNEGHNSWQRWYFGFISSHKRSETGLCSSPTLFSMVFAALLHDASHYNDDGIQLKYRTDGGVFNLRRLKAKTKVKVATLRELLFADDCALNSNTEEEMQQCVNHFSRACDNFGFTISTKKTEVMHQPAPRNMYHEPHIFVNDEPLKATDSFTYLGSTLSSEANIDMEFNNRLSKANSCIWKTQEESVGPTRNQPRDQAKGGLYMAVVLTVLLYARESWTVYSRHARKLNHLHMTFLRIILSTKWQDMVLTQKSSHEQASIAFTLYCRKLKWDGQATWHGCLMTAGKTALMVRYSMENDQLVGKRNASRTPLRRPSQASTLMSPTGKSVSRFDPCGAVWLPEQEQQKQTGKRAARKARLYSTISASAGPTYPCPEYGRVLQARIWLLATSATTGSTKHHLAGQGHRYSYSVTNSQQRLMSNGRNL